MKIHYGFQKGYYPNSFIKKIEEGELCTVAIIGFRHFPRGYNPYTGEYEYTVSEKISKVLPTGEMDMDLELKSIKIFYWFSITVPILFGSVWVKIKCI